MIRIAIIVLLVALAGVSAIASKRSPLPTRTESFDREPWDGHNNRQVPRNPPRVNQNFGYSSTTHHAGKASGEIGGEFWAALRPAYYGKVIEPKSMDDRLSASGTVSVLHAQSIMGWQTTSNVYVGWFSADPDHLIWRPANFLGFRLQSCNHPDGTIVELTYGTSAYQAGGMFVNAAGGGQEKMVRELKDSDLLRIPPDGSKHQWSIDYDPKAANGAGEIIFTFDGKESRFAMNPELRKIGAKFNRFGMFTPRIPGLNIIAYFDDITIDGQLEDFSKDPGWDEVGNRAKFEEPAQYAYNDFGYSKTRFAGNQRPGELGGRFFSCNPDEDQFKAHYGDRIGKLTLNDRLIAKGKFTARTFSIDSTFALGWFNSRGQGWPIRNFVGVYFDSLSDVGRIAQPLYGTSKGNERTGSSSVTWVPDCTVYEWTLEYDPAAENGRGAITFTMNEQSVTWPLAPGDREIGATFDRFGVFNMQWANSKWCDVYLDDLTYTVAQEPTR